MSGGYYLCLACDVVAVTPSGNVFMYPGSQVPDDATNIAALLAAGFIMQIVANS